VTLNDVEVPAKHRMEGRRAIIALASEAILQAGEKLAIAFFSPPKTS
jgi:hypothetical protein